MNRRTVIRSLLPVGIASLGGCAGQSGSQETARVSDSEAGEIPIIQVDPNNPRVGTPVAFTANIEDGSSYFYFWAFGEGVTIEGRGRSTTRAFNGAGSHVVKLLVVDPDVVETHLGGDPSRADTFGDVTGKADYSSNYAQHSTVVNVEELPREQLNIETGFVNIYLRGNRRNVSADEPARLEFSASNLAGERRLVVVLLLQVPTGLAVRGTSFDEGSGQYTTRYEVGPGGTKGESIELVANESGRYRIRGRAVYYFEDAPDERTSKSTKLTLNFRQ
jgi:hypothetical protein